MSRHHQQKFIDTLLASPLVLILLLITIGLVGNAVWGVYEKERMTQERIERARTEVEELKEREAFLEAEIEQLKTPEGQERALREQFGVAKPGEQMIVLVDDPNATITNTPADDSFWQKVKSFFGSE